MSIHILDIETNGLDNPDKLWCVVVKDTETGAIVHWSSTTGDPKHYKEFVSWVNTYAPVFVGHNIITYDLPVLQRLLPELSVNRTNVIDTLVTCRLLHFGVDGGNSLEAWGERLGCLKTPFTDFSKFSPEMLAYCIQDVLVTEKLYALLIPYLDSDTHRSALRLEHDTAWLCTDLHANGFWFDIDRATSLHLAISGELERLGAVLSEHFPPNVVSLGVVHPKLTKHGTLNRSQFRFLADPSELAQYNGGPFTRIGLQPFNPGSPKQCVERLWEFGWKPTDKTKGHISVERERRWCRDGHRIAELEDKLEHFRVYGWKINETNLDTLPRDAPEAAHKLVLWLMLNSRRSTLEEWFAAYNPETHRIHGQFNHIGAWTQRMSHNSPNTANIPGVMHDDDGNILWGVEGRYGADMRQLWQAAPEKYLVGVDADGIQLRILAHYMNDPRYIEAIIKGSKKNGTDQHSLNKLALGDVCRDRDTAKTFIYAFLLGAGVGKVAEILGCSESEARTAIDAFLNYYPGLRRLKDDVIPADASRGYFIGLDGRIVLCDSEHLMLAGYLQNGEAVIMKTANRIWINELRKEGIMFRQVNFVHDEWQVEVESLTDATKAGKIMVSAIEEAGRQLSMNCPLTGNANIGRNWLETH